MATIPYSPGMQIGIGWNTAKNKRAALPFEAKFDEDSLQTTQIGNATTHTEWYTTSEELSKTTENAIKVTAEANFGAVFSASVSTSVKWLLGTSVSKKNCGFYTTREYSTQEVKIKNIDSLPLSAAALKALNEGDFSKNYGDSLVIGLIYGANINIQATSRTTTDEEVKEFKTEVGLALSGSYGGFGGSGSFDMSHEEKSKFASMEDRTEWRAQCRGVNVDAFSKFGTSFAEVVSSAGKIDLAVDKGENPRQGTPISAILLSYESITAVVEAGFPGFPNKDALLMKDLASSWVRTAQAKVGLDDFQISTTKWADPQVTAAYHTLVSLTRSFYFNFSDIDPTNPGGKPWDIGSGADSQKHPMVTCGVKCLQATRLIEEIADGNLDQNSQQYKDVVSLNSQLDADFLQKASETKIRDSLTAAGLDPDVYLAGDNQLMSPLVTSMDQDFYGQYALANNSLKSLIRQAQFDKASQQEPYEMTCIIAGRMNILTDRSLELLQEYHEFCFNRVPQAIKNLQAAGENRSQVVNIIAQMKVFCTRQKAKAVQIQTDFGTAGRYTQSAWNCANDVLIDLQNEMKAQGIDVAKFENQINLFSDQIETYQSSIDMENNIIKTKESENSDLRNKIAEEDKWYGFAALGPIAAAIAAAVIESKKAGWRNEIDDNNTAIQASRDRLPGLRNLKADYENKKIEAQAGLERSSARIDELRGYILTLVEMETAIKALLKVSEYFEKFWGAWSTTFELMHESLNQSQVNIGAMIGNTTDECNKVETNWKIIGAMSDSTLKFMRLLPKITVPDMVPYPNQITGVVYQQHLDRVGFRCAEILGMHEYFRLESVGESKGDEQEFLSLSHGVAASVDNVRVGDMKASATLQYTFPLVHQNDDCVSIYVYPGDTHLIKRDFLAVTDAPIQVGDVIRFADPMWAGRGWSSEWIEVEIKGIMNGSYTFQGTTDMTYFFMSPLDASVKWEPVRMAGATGVGVEYLDEFLFVEGATPTEIAEDRNRKVAKRLRATWRCVPALDGSPVPNVSFESSYFTTEDAAGDTVRYFLTHDQDQVKLLPAPADDATEEVKNQFVWRPRPSLQSGFLKAVDDNDELLAPPRHFG